MCRVDAGDTTKYENMCFNIGAWTKTAVEKWQASGNFGDLKVTVVPMWKNSDGHESGSSDPWVNAAQGAYGDGSPWHPNINGVRWMGNALYHYHKG